MPISEDREFAARQKEWEHERVVDQIMIDLHDRTITVNDVATRNDVSESAVRHIAKFHHFNLVTRESEQEDEQEGAVSQ